MIRSTDLVAVAPNGLMAGRGAAPDTLNGGIAWTSVRREAATWPTREDALRELDARYPRVAEWIRDGQVRLNPVTTGASS